MRFPSLICYQRNHNSFPSDHFVVTVSRANLHLKVINTGLLDPSSCFRLEVSKRQFKLHQSLQKGSQTQIVGSDSILKSISVIGERIEDTLPASHHAKILGPFIDSLAVFENGDQSIKARLVAT